MPPMNAEIAPDALYESRLTALTRLSQGKVRDIYAVDAEHLLIVASDRLSAFDVILPDPIPGKGEILTQLSNFWFAQTADWMPNHLSARSVRDVLPRGTAVVDYERRSVVAKRLKPVPVEAIARGYIIGSGWKDYQATGRISGVELPQGLQLAERLREPIFTPSTKAAVGDHDENIGFDDFVARVGGAIAEQVRDLTLKLYRHAADYARERGIIIADTKFEFGIDEQGTLRVMDEILTPDSSRFWDASEYRAGISPPSFDKQFVRDYLETLDWNKRAPGPMLPKAVIEGTRAKYRQALALLTGSASG
jgi:phosphoribosylaminoimidazole-succinocarboxamide synthase